MVWSKILSWVVLGVLAVTVVGMLGLVMYRQSVSAYERDMQAGQIAALQAGLEEANARLAEQGEPPVAVPEVEPGASPTVVPILPSDAQIQAVLVECFADGRCPVPQDGKDAEPLTNEQIVAAAQECFASGACFIEPPKDGKDGVDGTNGVDGEKGDPGPPPTPEAIMAAVEALCATGVCTGPRGEPGPICPDGYDTETLLVLTRTDMAPEWREAVLCTPNTEG